MCVPTLRGQGVVVDDGAGERMAELQDRVVQAHESRRVGGHLEQRERISARSLIQPVGDLARNRLTRLANE